MSELFYNRVVRLNPLNAQRLNDSVYSVNIMLFYQIYLHFTYEAIQTTGVYNIQTLSKMQPSKDKQ